MTRRARRTFWALVAVAVLATGTLSRVLSGGPSPAAGIAVGASGLILAIVLLLAARILAVAARPTRDQTREARPGR